MSLSRAVEVAAWSIGLALLCAYVAVRGWSAAASAEAVAAHRSAQPALPADHADAGDGRALPEGAPPDVAAPRFTSGSTDTDDAAPSFPLTPPELDAVVSRTPVVAVAKLPAAVLRIPSVALEVPVDPGTDEWTLTRGAGHIEGTAELGSAGNVGIAAHRDSFFRPLKDIVLDAEIRLAVDGREWRYRVVDIRIVDPDETHVLDPTPVPSVTLVTCYPFFFVGSAPRRYIVRAELEDAPPQDAHGIDAPLSRRL